jgi:hypothetical protein
MNESMHASMLALAEHHDISDSRVGRLCVAHFLDNLTAIRAITPIEYRAPRTTGLSERVTIGLRTTADEALQAEASAHAVSKSAVARVGMAYIIDKASDFATSKEFLQLGGAPILLPEAPSVGQEAIVRTDPFIQVYKNTTLRGFNK